MWDPPLIATALLARNFNHRQDNGFISFSCLFVCLVLRLTLDVQRRLDNSYIRHTTLCLPLQKSHNIFSHTSRKFNCGLYFDGDVHYVTTCGTRTALRMLPLLLPNDLRPGRYVQHACKTCPPAVLRLMVLRALAQWR